MDQVRTAIDIFALIVIALGIMVAWAVVKAVETAANTINDKIDEALSELRDISSATNAMSVSLDNIEERLREPEISK